MIEKIKIIDIVHEALDGTDKFLVNVKITPDNRIYVDIDGDNGITIDDCIGLSRTIEGSLNREEEDFALDVSSAGADAPLKMSRQYVKNVGRHLEVDLMDGGHCEGLLQEADSARIVLKTKGTKKQAPQELTIEYGDIRQARVMIQF